jgi:hypothetical protein
MPKDRPACEIEPTRPIASSSRILPGPIERLDSKSTRNVNLGMLTMRLRLVAATIHRRARLAPKKWGRRRAFPASLQREKLG